MSIAIQDQYAEPYSHCYGCGRLNAQGLQIKSYVEGDEVICHFQPRPYDLAIPGYVYGGLLASLIDCHGVGTAIAARYAADGRPMGSAPAIRCVTASLRVDYVKPTPVDAELEIRARVAQQSARKSVVAVEVHAAGELRARGEVVAVVIPADYMQGAEQAAGEQ